MEIGFVPVLLLRSGSQVFGLPLLVVEELLKVEASLLHLGAAQTFVSRRDRLFQLRDLGELLGLRLASTPRPGQPLLVVAAKDLRVGLLVDEVLGHVELALKPLPGRLARLAPYQGLSQIAGGDPVLILRQEWLVDPATGGGNSDAGRRRALVVDDSLTARALHRAVLESAGYVVNIAPSGAEALALLGLAHYDVVICDIGMQGMDGFEFLGHLRSQGDLRSVPVIMVSAREEEAVRRQALEAGAKAFLSKKDCASGRLMDEVAAILERRKGGRRAAETADAGGR
jgi:CheY-like chemotaxis protein